jgi:hypothetical protein
MNGYISYTELQSVVTERLAQGKRQRIALTFGRRLRVRELVMTLLAFVF